MGTTVLARGALLLVPVIVTAFLSPPAQAEEQALSLPQAIEHSLRNNGELAALRAEQGIRDAGMVRAGLLPNPTLELEAGSGALTGSNDENSITVGISQEFFLSGIRERRLDLAERDQEVFRWQLADRERLLREEIKTAFYDAVLAQERVALAERAIALNRQLLEVTRDRLAAGDIPELEMNLVKVELARSEGVRIDSEKGLIRSRSRLWTLAGLSPDHRPALAGTLEPERDMPRSLASLKELAIASRPDLKSLETERSRGAADLALAEAESVPSLTAGIFYTREQRSDETGMGEEKVRDNLLGIRLSMPLPLFDRNQAGAQEARARKSGSESRLEAAVKNVAREVEAAYADQQNAADVLSLYSRDILPQLQENLKLTQEAYRLGEVGIIAVIQEQKKFFDVSDGYLTALHARQLALVRLEAAVGGTPE